MYNSKHVYAIVTAAGKGNRMGTELPKQFLKTGGTAVLRRATEAFEKNSCIDGIVVLSHPDYMNMTRETVKGLNKVMAVIPGGRERQDSVYEGLKFLDENRDEDIPIVLIHDGARPYVTEGIIQGVTEAVRKGYGAVPAVPVKDTVRMVEDISVIPKEDAETSVNPAEMPEADSTSDEFMPSVTLDRSRLHLIQTPQGFLLDELKSSYEKAFSEGFYGTDDAGLFERAGGRVILTEGDYRNIKITTPEDLPGSASGEGEGQNDNCRDPEKTLSKNRGASRMIRVGTGFDVHRLVEGRKCILCGVEIPCEKGLLGHSDADVALHALMDSMLGAAGLGDIGRHFPDTASEFEGISSMELLKRVNLMLAEKGFKVGNCDITVICQKPKIAAYIDQMRSNIAGILEIPVSCVNVKGTTTEKLGFTGRGEGIASEAVCIITGA